MENKYDFKLVEDGRNEKWQKKGFFVAPKNAKKPFSIITPPPNVTGQLHLGHSWNVFIQDSLIRFHKLQGFDVLLLPSVDHAGIATQVKVEENLAKQNISKFELGREKFVQKCYEWKEQQYLKIKEQWNKLGICYDFSKERFTLDKEAQIAVSDFFIKLWEKNLIYRGEKAINWDVKLQTAISNIEVINKPVEQKMYYLKYFLENSNDFLTVATTRIETISSDVALAVNPKDKRYLHLIGKKVIHPLTKKLIKIIADSNVGIDFGSGVMKVSAHSILDFEIMEKHNLSAQDCIDNYGNLNKNVPGFEGKNRFVARNLIAEKLEKEGFLIKTETVISNVGFSQRSDEIVEILKKPQWFVKMDKLAQSLLLHLDSKDKIHFYPQSFEKNLKKWFDKIHDWTISRQLWWGHRIPVWYKNNEFKVQIESPGSGWTQDEDVLDTWFSSGISAFAFLGWPQNDQLIKSYFPTSLLVTGWDILFFWVARMYFSSLFVMGEKPFKKVLLHGLIRDEVGRKMSKSLGNGVDPMEVIEKYGSDTLRQALIFNSSPGKDIRFSVEKLNSAWNLNNKLWNIAKYIEDLDSTFAKPDFIDLWMEEKIYNLKREITRNIKKYNFSVIGTEINNFIYADFSSRYIELIKTRKNGFYARKLLKKILVILHPFIPFLTDFLMEKIFKLEILEQKMPTLKRFNNSEQVENVLEIIDNLRTYREKFQISKKIILEYCVIDKNFTNEEIEIINKLTFGKWSENDELIIKTKNFKIALKIPDELRKEQEKRELKEIKFLKDEILRAEKILSNQNFLKKAPKEKIDLERTKLVKLKEKLEFYEKK
ncbi:valine--tRNA ligase [Mesomycoplasma dispar]|uniref:Valine--tRNA ligase n=1 Tax=Mesomycoplasma dispar TaxID=86660 RepID=A0ABM6PS82_9BACT|nr:valine--tRNA ligase [Mesomycoplasma dispar]ATP60023.1 valine--tRNA ligase [Mesomycoplasma dispar]